ncbi:MAG: hypothetical protein WCF84_16225 [Anaerolineae bacterium]
MIGESKNLAGTLYTLFFIVTALYYVGFAVATAVRTATWQRRIA